MKLCRRTGCPHEAFVAPQISVWGTFDKSDQPVTLMLPLEICAVHKATLKVRDFVTPVARRTVSLAIQQSGGENPVWDTAEIRWIPLRKYPF